MDVPSEILDVAKRLLKNVRQSGSENVMAICPFHLGPGGTEERHPSFAMSLTKGVYFCHACHARGTLYTFFKELGLDRQSIQLHYGMLIEEAAKYLPSPKDPLRPELWVEDDQAIEEGLLGLFEHDIQQLLPVFSPETLTHFEVGWDGWHNRVTFPVRDIKGHLVGISGRSVYEGQRPKYKVYDKREYGCWKTPYDKGNKRAWLWNAYRVFPELTLNVNPEDESRGLIVVEGFKAGMWVHQSGITNVVALLGSYLTWEQQLMLESMSVPVYLFLDNNDPGWEGQLDAAERLEAKGIWTRIVEYPDRLREEEKAQPDSLTAEEVHEQVARAPAYTEWVLRH